MLTREVPHSFPVGDGQLKFYCPAVWLCASGKKCKHIKASPQGRITTGFPCKCASCQPRVPSLTPSSFFLTHCLGIPLTTRVTPAPLTSSSYYILSPLMSCGRSPITELSDRSKNSPGIQCIIYSCRKGRTTSIILLYVYNTNTDGLCADVCMQMHVRPDNICHVNYASRRGRVRFTSEHVVGHGDDAVIFISFCGVGITAEATCLNIQQPADFYMI